MKALLVASFLFVSVFSSISDAWVVAARPGWGGYYGGYNGAYYGCAGCYRPWVGFGPFWGWGNWGWGAPLIPPVTYSYPVYTAPYYQAPVVQSSYPYAVQQPQTNVIVQQQQQQQQGPQQPSQQPPHSAQQQATTMAVCPVYSDGKFVTAGSGATVKEAGIAAYTACAERFPNCQVGECH